MGSDRVPTGDYRRVTGAVLDAMGADLVRVSDRYFGSMDRRCTWARRVVFQSEFKMGFISVSTEHTEISWSSSCRGGRKTID